MAIIASCFLPSMGQLFAAEASKTPGVRVVQPVQEYFFSYSEESRVIDGKSVDHNPMRFYTHIGTDYGRMGPGEPAITWKPGMICLDLRGAGWAGMWHSLAGVAREKNDTLDLRRCYADFVADAYQPRCVGVTVRVRGQGMLKIEIKSAEDTVLWSQVGVLNTGDDWRELALPLDSRAMGPAKFLNWVAEPGAQLCIDAIGLVVEFPPMDFGKRLLLCSYAKLARCYSPSDAVVKDRANFPAGDFDSVPASGLFCLATSAAWTEGIVDRQFAAETLRRVHQAVARLPRASGLLPHFIRKQAGSYRIHPGTEYSTVDTSIYFHSMLLAAQMLSDTRTLAELEKALKSIDFERLRDNDGFIIHGLKDDGATRLDSSWRDWGGETALVLLAERIAVARRAKTRMNRDGKVFGGVGFIAEIGSLFYPQFANDEPDAVTGVNWLHARRALLTAQMEYFPKQFPDSAAAKFGIYGLSAGEGPGGVGYAANGTDKSNVSVIHPHYIVMSGLLRPRPDDAYATLQSMEAKGLIPPWGMVENVDAGLTEYLPMIGSLNASFESLGAYHLWARAAAKPDRIYEATQSCTVLADAIKAFYPRIH